MRLDEGFGLLCLRFGLFRVGFDLLRLRFVLLCMRFGLLHVRFDFFRRWELPPTRRYACVGGRDMLGLQNYPFMRTFFLSSAKV